MRIHCNFSDCKKYRYTLSASWNRSLPEVLFIGLNPSLANEFKLDPTVNKCVRLAKKWGYGKVELINLFGLITPYPQMLFESKDPIGIENDSWITKKLHDYQNTIAIWGNHGTYKNRYLSVLEKVERPLCLKINKTGMPAHPLYLKESVLPFSYSIE